MIRGIYASASGMIVESLRTDVISNNLANVSTSGYKKDVAVSRDFASWLMRRINDGQEAPAIGNMGVGAVVEEIATNHAGGSIRPTGKNFDLAIDGKGFFAVQTPAGVRYTRNGEFTRNSRGQLVTTDGHPVLGQRGPINVDGQKYNVSNDGRVFVDDEEVDRLRFVEFADRKEIYKEGASLYNTNPNARPMPATGRIEQGMLEGSNGNVVGEMVNMIAAYRAYELNGKMVQTHDQLLEKAITEVGKV